MTLHPVALLSAYSLSFMKSNILVSPSFVSLSLSLTRISLILLSPSFHLLVSGDNIVSSWCPLISVQWGATPIGIQFNSFLSCYSTWCQLPNNKLRIRKRTRCPFYPLEKLSRIGYFKCWKDIRPVRTLMLMMIGSAPMMLWGKSWQSNVRAHNWLKIMETVKWLIWLGLLFGILKNPNFFN